jgi:hypothetical protein
MNRATPPPPHIPSQYTHTHTHRYHYIYLAEQLYVLIVLYLSATISEQAVTFNVITLQCIRTLILVITIQDTLTGTDFCIKQEIRSDMNIY